MWSRRLPEFRNISNLTVGEDVPWLADCHFASSAEAASADNFKGILDKDD